MQIHFIFYRFSFRRVNVELQSIIRKAIRVILYDTVFVNTCHCTVVKIHEFTTQRVGPHVNYGLKLIIIYQYWLIICNKCTIPMQNVNNRGNGRSEGVYRQSLFSALHKLLKK